MLSESMAARYARAIANNELTEYLPDSIMSGFSRNSMYFQDGSACCMDFGGDKPVLISLRWERRPANNPYPWKMK